MSGKLFLVGVPIGNSEDITLRAIKTLENVDVIAAEDTRKAKRLLQDIGIKTSAYILAHGSHNEHQSVEGIKNLLLQGKHIAYISDAGMPGISDPGYLLVQMALKENIDVDVIPGITAITTALSISGISSDRFLFYGFLPKKEKERTKTLQTLKNIPFTLGFYESPRRVLKTLQNIHTVFGNRRCVAARELTKTHQEYVRGTLEDVIKIFQNRDDILGEFTIIIEANHEEECLTDENIKEFILSMLKKEVHIKEIQKELSTVYSGSKQDLYKYILTLKEKM